MLICNILLFGFVSECFLALLLNFSHNLTAFKVNVCCYEHLSFLNMQFTDYTYLILSNSVYIEWMFILC